MDDGEVSKVIPAAGQFVIIKRESLLPADNITLEQIKPKLEEMIREKKMHAVANDVFDQLKKHTQRSSRACRSGHAAADAGHCRGGRRQPNHGAATGQGVHLARGAEVLEGAIGRKLIDQACKQQNITVSEKDLDAEVARAGVANGQAPAQRARHVQGFLKMVAEKQGITAEVYRHDAVWPRSRCKLVQDKIQITERGLEKGYQSNYGPRVKMPGHRARTNPPRPASLGTGPEAAHHHPFRRARRGVFHRGKQPLAGGRSAADPQAHGTADVGKRGIRLETRRDLGRDPTGRQVCDPFLRRIYRAGCDGQVRGCPRPDLRQTSREKKQREEMAAYFERLQKSATIDNFITGTSQTPTNDPADGHLPQLRSVSGMA